MKTLLLTKEFTKQTENVLTPLFLEEGFTEQGIDHYRRYVNPFIHCIWLQERSDMEAMCVNLGVHLDFLPVPGRITTPPITDVIEMECSIRVRLTPNDVFDYWWPSSSAKKQVTSIKDLYIEKGIPFFEKYTSFPDIFEKIEIDDIKSGEALKILPEKSWIGMAVFLAQIHKHIGNNERAIQFSNFGLELLKDLNPRHTRGTIKELKDIIRFCEHK